MKIDEQMISVLKKEADRDLPIDDEDQDFNPQDWSGGNFDDCYEMGFRHGRIDMARDVLRAAKEKDKE